MQIGIDVTCMHSNFGGWDLSGFRDFAPFCLPSNLAKFPFRTREKEEPVDLAVIITIYF